MITVHSGFPGHGMRLDIEKTISDVSPALMSSVGMMLAVRIGSRIFQKVVLASLPPLKRRRRIRRALISRAKHPTRSKFKGARSMFANRFLVA